MGRVSVSNKFWNWSLVCTLVSNAKYIEITVVGINKPIIKDPIYIKTFFGYSGRKPEIGLSMTFIVGFTTA